MTKQSLRSHVLARLRTIAPARRHEQSAKARALLQEQLFWRDAKQVLLYAPLDGELDVWPLVGAALASGKIVALPRFNAQKGHYEAAHIIDSEKDIVRGHFGIREPNAGCPWISINRLDLVLAPGVAFTVHGSRLGRGKGYYDQLLADVHGRTCGVAFDEQIVETIPDEPHDQRMNCILTPTRWLEL